MNDHRKSKRSTATGRRRGVPLSVVGQRPDAKRGPPIVGCVSLGCVKNLVDSEKMLGQIAESGAIISDESAADTIVVNTCGFLESARQEALEVIRQLVERKRRGDLQRLVVAGCLVQRDGEKLCAAIPEIDALVGVNNRDDVPAAVWGNRHPSPSEPGAPATGPATLLKRSGTSSGPQAPAPHQAPGLYLGDYHPQPWSDQGRLRLTPRHYAYVRISEGCDQKCTFCTIPAIRGPLHCKTPEGLAIECRELIADGARELILIGQDTTSYGVDIGYESGLAGLLRTLAATCAGARWLRLMYAYPSVFSAAMIDAIAECPRVVKYVDLPLQHINDRILKTMGRRVTRQQTEDLLDELRRRIPGLTIRTTFMVGFPGETEAEFEELATFVHDLCFDAVGTFTYSCEPDTPAGRMPDQLDEAVKKERYERLMLAQQDVAFAAARGRIGQRFEVVVDECGPARSLARHAGQAPEVDGVCVLRGGVFAPGELVAVRVVDCAGYDLGVEPVAGQRGLPASAGGARGCGA